MLVTKHASQGKEHQQRLLVILAETMTRISHIHRPHPTHGRTAPALFPAPIANSCPSRPISNGIPPNLALNFRRVPDKFSQSGRARWMNVIRPIFFPTNISQMESNSQCANSHTK
jgi:hypothetical protein